MIVLAKISGSDHELPGFGERSTARPGKSVVLVAENTPGLRSIGDKVAVFSPEFRSMMGSR